MTTPVAGLSTHFLNAHQSQHVYVYPDINPWGGISLLNSTDFVAKARVEDVTINEGANFDTATIIMSDSVFGDEFPYFQPVKLVVIDNINTGGVGINNSGNGAGVIVLFRGFITKQNATLSPEKEEVRINLVDYKWLLSKNTIIHGQVYKCDAVRDPATNTFIDASASPVQKGSGLTLGSGRYDFEKFRIELGENTGFLQESECVFNRGGLPDCYVDNNTGTVNAVFYKSNVNQPPIDEVDPLGYNEKAGLISNHWKGRNYTAYYWTFATILSYIERYWIEPYNSTFANVRIAESDLAKIKSIDKLDRRPMDFSIEGSNPLTALDNVVKNLPGRWIWYLDYASNNVKIRIRELKPFGTQNISLRVCSGVSKLAQGDKNVTSASVNRDASKAVKNMVLKGGKIKINTTIKLIPLWERFEDGEDEDGNTRYKDFYDETDYREWRRFVRYQMGQSNDGLDVSVTLFGAEDTERFSRIYRVYGVPEEGSLLGSSIQKDDADDQIDFGSPDFKGDTSIKLTGDIGKQYSSHTTNLREMFYSNVQLKREVAPPVYNRYSDNVIVFMYDPRQAGKLSDGNTGTVTETQIGNNIKRKPRTSGNETPDEVKQFRDDKWVIPEDNNISYSFDDKSGIVKFDIPQVQVRKSPSDDALSNVISNIGNYQASAPTTDAQIQARSRDIFMTATFTTDMGCVFDARTNFGLIDRFHGSTFSGYETQNNTDIIVHSNAWYPLTETNKDVAEPESSTDTLGGDDTEGNSRELGTKIRKCDTFDDYTFYIGHSPQEAIRNLKAQAENLKFYDEDVSASLAYMETGYNIGDRVTKIEGTKYIDLESYLMSIGYRLEGDSDNYTTNYSMKNYTGRNRKSTGYNSPKDEANKQKESNRYICLYVNEEGQELE